MEYKLHNGSGGLCCKGCSRQDKKLNTYDWLADIPGNAEESDMVEVQFKNTRKGYFRNSNKIKLEKGDVVAVEAAPGHDIGVVTLTGRLVPLQMKKANFKADAEIKRVYRKAKPVDMEKFNEAKAKEHATMIRARQIALNLNLDMKIGDVVSSYLQYSTYLHVHLLLMHFQFSEIIQTLWPVVRPDVQCSANLLYRKLWT